MSFQMLDKVTFYVHVGTHSSSILGKMFFIVLYAVMIPLVI